MKMRRVLSLLLSFALVMVFTGVLGTATQAKAAAAAADKKVVIWAWDQNLPSINYAVKQYKKTNPNVTVEVQSVPDTVSKISTFLASGVGTDLPDLVLMDNLQIQTFLQQFPDKFVNLSKMGFDKYKVMFSKAHWEILSNKGSIYGFPFDIAPMMMEVNTSIMAKAKVDPKKLKTWDDVIKATASIKKAGFATHIKFTVDDVIPMMQAAGVGMLAKDGTIDLLNPKVIEVIQKYMELVKAGASDPKVEDANQFALGKVAMQVKPAWMIGEDMASQKALNGKVTLVPTPMIKNAAGYTSSANSGGSSFFILETSKLKQESYEIARIITTDMESQNIALAQGLMPGNLKAATLKSVSASVKYYGGQPIWKMLSDSSVKTPLIYVNQYYSTAKDLFKNVVIDQVNTKTSKTAKQLLQEAADQIASQTGLKIKKY